MSNATNRLARVAAIGLSAFAFGASAVPVLGQGTPAAGSAADACLAAATPAATMDAGAGMTGMGMGSPMAGMDMSTMPLDQMYIDMMIPHHASIIALSEAAMPRLTDARLQDIARSIVEAQSAEIDELRGYREQFYGDPNPMPMNQAMMDAMAAMMPGMGSMDEMAFQMDAAAQVAAICDADDADLAFIDLVTAHHRMAIAASEPVAAGAANEEIRAFAERAIADQQREIDELSAIRQDLYGSATPEPAGA